MIQNNMKLVSVERNFGNILSIFDQRETDKLLFGVFKYPIIFLEYPIIFQTKVSKSKGFNEYPIKIVEVVQKIQEKSCVLNPI